MMQLAQVFPIYIDKYGFMTAMIICGDQNQNKIYGRLSQTRDLQCSVQPTASGCTPSFDQWQPFAGEIEKGDMILTNKPSTLVGHTDYSPTVNSLH